MFDFITNAASGAWDWISSTVDSIFGGAVDEDYGGFASLKPSATGLMDGNDWLKKAAVGGFSALASPKGQGGGGNNATRLMGSVGGERMPVRAMGNAQGPQALRSESGSAIDAYWADRMRAFGRLSDGTAVTKGTK